MALMTELLDNPSAVPAAATRDEALPKEAGIVIVPAFEALLTAV
jgi:hypothetical protein